MTRDDDAYYRRRLIEEEKAMRLATCRAARDRHEELLAAYRFRLQCAPRQEVFSNTLGFAVADQSADLSRGSPRLKDLSPGDVPMPALTQQF